MRTFKKNIFNSVINVHYWLRIMFYNITKSCYMKAPTRFKGTDILCTIKTL